MLLGLMWFRREPTCLSCYHWRLICPNPWDYRRCNGLGHLECSCPFKTRKSLGVMVLRVVMGPHPSGQNLRIVGGTLFGELC